MTPYAQKIADFILSQKRAIPRDSEELRRRVLAQDPGALKAAREIADLVAALPEHPDANGQQPTALLVGGFVRDAVLGLHPKDADLEVYGVPSTALQEALERAYPGKVDLVGKAYGVIKVEFEAEIDIDIAIPRPPFGVNRALHHSGDPSIPPIEGGHLRDYTMNNVAADPYTGEVYDWWGGIDDLNSNQLRATYPEFFITDPLCVWRGVQFSARRQLIPEQKTLALMRHMVAEGIVDQIEPYQRRLQLNKLFFKSNIPSIGVELMRSLGLIHRYVDVLDHCCESEALWNRTLKLTDTISELLQTAPYELDEHEVVNCFGSALCSGLHPESNNSQDKLIDAAHSFSTALGFSPQFAAAVAMILIKLHLVDSFGKSAPAKKQTQQLVVSRPGRAAGGLNFGPSKSDPKADLSTILREAFPASWKSLHLCASAARFVDSGQRSSKGGDEFLKTAQLLGEDDIQRETLLSKDDLIRTLRIKRGAHIGLIIGEVEKMRFELVTKKRALQYVRENLMPA
ncbi:MAG: hypothetical protein KDD66_04880 [Bdellovibrionales bacterium]|nr:hypothetical protein [Bdellovibrionales bacterium]